MKNALIGRCKICGMVNAVDLTDSPRNRREMEYEDREILSVTREEAAKLWETAGKCDHLAFVANLKTALIVAGDEITRLTLELKFGYKP